MINKFHLLNPYSLKSKEKQTLLCDALVELTEHHRENCEIYRNILNGLNYKKSNIKSHYDIPFIPVRLFKEMELLSIERKDIFKTMTSSGTTGQMVSKIFVDKDTALLQQKVLIRLLNDFIGNKRLPMLIIDSPEIIKNRDLFTSRGAVILGFNFISTEMCFALNEDMTLNIGVLKEFLTKHANERFVIFGFTFMLWKHFYKELLKIDERFDLNQAYMLQSGGWKKLESEAISRSDFKKSFEDLCNIKHFVDMYGMVEQTGCNYMECEYGHFHASIYSDIITRNPLDFSVCKIGEKGIIQIVSVLARSYPGHSLLTEDEGIVLGEDNCPCGRNGKYVKIIGRIKNAELRGCSDTYATKF